MLTVRPRGFRWTTHVVVWALQLPVGLFYAYVQAALLQRWPWDSAPSLWLVLACLSLMVVAIAVHEAGHRFALNSTGRPSSMLIAPLGGMVRADDGLPLTAAVAAAGPAASIVLAAAAWALAAAVSGLGSTAEGLLRLLAWFSAVVGVLNMVPVFPLDGGQFVAALIRRAPERTRALVSCGHKAFSAAFAATLTVVQLIHVEYWTLAWEVLLLAALTLAATLALLVELDSAHRLGLGRFAFRWIVLGVVAGAATSWWLVAPVIRSA